MASLSQGRFRQFCNRPPVKLLSNAPRSGLCYKGLPDNNRLMGKHPVVHQADELPQNCTSNVAYRL
jgi:hypothetical protein